MKLISQIGMLIEFLGAAWLVFAAFRGYRGAQDAPVQSAHFPFENEDAYDSLEGRIRVAFEEVAGEFRDLARQQWRNALLGFVFLAVGVFLQIIGTI